jgi:hypothetical protein
VRAISARERVEECYELPVAKFTRRTPLQVTGLKWKDNIKMNLRELWCQTAAFIHMTLDTVRYRDFVNTLMNLQVQ